MKHNSFTHILLCALIACLTPSLGWASLDGNNSKSLQITATAATVVVHLLAHGIPNTFNREGQVEPDGLDATENHQAINVVETDNSNAQSYSDGALGQKKSVKNEKNEKNEKKKKKKKVSTISTVPAQCESIIETKQEEAEPQEELFNRRYLNGFDIDSAFIRERVLPPTHNNCALFGIYGNNRVTRRQVVNQLLGHADLDEDLSRHIRALMANQILADLFAAHDPEDILKPLGANDILRDLVNEWKKKNNKNNRKALLRELAKSDVFQKYVIEFIGTRIGNSNRDPYPMLEIVPGNTQSEGATGAIAAIAAMNGVSLSIYQRNGQGHVEQVVGYLHPERFNNNQEARVVHLLHTTADPDNNPGALNHFNVIEGLESLETLQSDSIPVLVVLDPYQAGKAEQPCCLSISNTGHIWCRKLGYPILRNQWTEDGESSAATFALLDDTSCGGYPYKKGTISGRLSGVTVMHEGFAYPSFLNPCSENYLIYMSLIDEVNQVLNKIKELNGGLDGSILCELTGWYQKSPQPLYSPHQIQSWLNNQMIKQALDHVQTVLFKHLKSMERMQPTLRNMQLNILIIDLLLNRIIKRRSDLRQATFKANDLILRIGLEDFLNNWFKQIETRLDYQITVVHYFLNQLINFCRMNGYEPVVPNYNPQEHEAGDKELMEALLFAAGAHPASLENKQGNQESERAIIIDTADSICAIADDGLESNSNIVVTDGICEDGHTPDESGYIVQESTELQAAVELIEDQDEAFNWEHWEQAAFRAYCQELRQKKLANRRAYTREPSVPSNTSSPVAQIHVLIPQEREEFQAYLRAHASKDVLRAYELFLTTAHMRLSQQKIDWMAGRVSNLLRAFLISRTDEHGGRVFTDQAIATFINLFKSEHAKTYHAYHAKKEDKVPSEWVKFRQLPWIMLGIMPAPSSKFYSLAHAHYQEGLFRRKFR